MFASTALKYGFGAYAEFKNLPENGIVTLKPSNLTMNEAASLPFGGITGHHFIEKAQLKPRQKILINGVSGAVGVILLQLAKLKGVHVTGICSEKNADKIKSLGADVVIDYNTKSITEINQKFDVIFNTIEKQDTTELMQLLSTSGKLVLVAASLNQLFKVKFRSIFSSQKVFGGMSVESLNSLEVICDLAEKNLLKPIIDRVYKFSEIKEVHAYVEKGHKLGNVVVEI